MYTFIHKLFRNTQDRVLLGRWERTDKLANKIKIDWANTDHCGTCGYVTVPSTPTLKQTHVSLYPIQRYVPVASSLVLLPSRIDSS